MADFARFVGIDVSKDTFCVFHSDTERTYSLENTPDGFVKLIKNLGEKPGQLIALEPTGGCEWALWEALVVAGYEVRQVSASHVRSFARSLGTLAKTDPLDARVIARFIAYRPNAGRSLPTAKIRELNVLLCKRRQIVDMRKQLRCQSKQHTDIAVENMDDELLTVLSQQIDTLDERIETLLATDKELRQRAAILRSIPGFGPVLTANLIGKMPELGALHEKQVAALVGLAPINCESGKYKGYRRIKGGRGGLRRLLYQAALSAARFNPILHDFAKRLRTNGKPHKVILIAVARKLIVLANSLLAKNVMWKPST